jgi:PHD/YefM family antitoxin component YafN of YafNO toxin-antitoxin module
MPEKLNKIKPQYIVDENGQKTAVLINLEEYKSLIDLVEDLEDARDLLKAELETRDFTPYEEFRTKWLNPGVTK